MTRPTGRCWPRRKTADHGGRLVWATPRSLRAKADAKEKARHSRGDRHTRSKAVAEAKGEEAKAVAIEKVGTAEASVMQQKYGAEANGIEDKAERHEAIRQRRQASTRSSSCGLNKDKDIEIAAIQRAGRQIAEAQSNIVGEALKSARIDIVGGETTFFDKIVDSIKGGKAVDRFVHNSETLTDVKNTFFNGNPEYFKQKLQGFIDQFGMSFEDVKDLSVSALIGKMLLEADDESKADLNRLLDFVKSTGNAGKKVKALGLGLLENSK